MTAVWRARIVLLTDEGFGTAAAHPAVGPEVAKRVAARRTAPAIASQVGISASSMEAAMTDRGATT